MEARERPEREREREEEDFLAAGRPRPLTRRRFFGWLGWGSVALALGGFANGALLYLFPRITYEPSTAFTVGRPEDYEVGTFKAWEAKRVFVFRTPHGFQTITMICTHLGCSYKPFGPPDEDFPIVHAHCPCHGSVFARDGRVLAGPAPRPLPFFALRLTPDGRLEVDTAQVVPPTRYLDPEKNPAGMVEGPVPDGSDLRFV